MRKRIIIDPALSEKPNVLFKGAVLISKNQVIDELTKLIPPESREESWITVMQRRIVEDCINRINMLPVHISQEIQNKNDEHDR